MGAAGMQAHREVNTAEDTNRIDVDIYIGKTYGRPF